MKKTGLFLVVLFFLPVASFAQEGNQNEKLCSLKISEAGLSEIRLAGSKKTVVVIDSKVQKTQDFLSKLWKHNRPLFKNDKMNMFGPDSEYEEISFVCGKEKIIASSWHRLYENNPKLVVTSHGVQPLNGKTREEILATDEKWYLNFRNAFDNIYEEAMKYKE